MVNRNSNGESCMGITSPPPGPPPNRRSGRIKRPTEKARNFFWGVWVDHGTDEHGIYLTGWSNIFGRIQFSWFFVKCFWRIRFLWCFWGFLWFSTKSNQVHCEISFRLFLPCFTRFCGLPFWVSQSKPNHTRKGSPRQKGIVGSMATESLHALSKTICLHLIHSIAFCQFGSALKITVAKSTRS